ncbi:helix-turn-helix domain-containing protein [Streptomyces roseicoloratus]|uniref:Pyridoxamine 5'-phosphate oxidase family protein n=1 Tax=Streptomyces roseicoloratus TaxID=2508722 RepID=A0ABY9S3H4_9ACTN|nr:pyridoxamine 5'-phosphate oxidase family protein [Streptomyces roseicoloratus]WMX48436.1 pyridoxamine 5'-phosphate oxidase family protein [Streptomyces roseicoloratus]
MNPAARHHMSDLGRRVEARRTQLGLSREDVAARAGSTPGYIDLLEEQLPSPAIEFLVRLANALETTVQDLTGYTADLAPGRAHAGHHARMVEIDETECWALLDDHGVGRVAVTRDDGPEIFPMNYQVVGREVLFMTTEDTPLARAAGGGAAIAFEEDHVDEAFSQGWSVLLVGPARKVSDPATAQTLRAAAYSTPWAGERRDTVVVLSPRRVTGRRVLVQGAPGTSSAPEP